jgi:hypothetical protein
MFQIDILPLIQQFNNIEYPLVGCNNYKKLLVLLGLHNLIEVTHNFNLKIVFVALFTILLIFASENFELFSQ